MTGLEFRAALKHLNLSQRALAARLGVETSTVNRWALGKAPVPQYAAYVLELLARLAVPSGHYAVTNTGSNWVLTRTPNDGCKDR